MLLVEGNQKYNLKLINGEVQVNLYKHSPFFNRYVCEYRCILNNHEIYDKFEVDPYEKGSILDKLIDRLAGKIALDLSLNFIEKQHLDIQEIFIKE